MKARRSKRQAERKADNGMNPASGQPTALVLIASEQVWPNLQIQADGTADQPSANRVPLAHGRGAQDGGRRDAQVIVVGWK